eukprot:SAG22_NODE_1366_length_4595_cov_5.475979_2_plen_82_part_00
MVPPWSCHSKSSARSASLQSSRSGGSKPQAAQSEARSVTAPGCDAIGRPMREGSRRLGVSGLRRSVVDGCSWTSMVTYNSL